MIHTFSANPIDRVEAIRKDDKHLRNLKQTTPSLFLLFKDFKVLTTTQEKLATIQWLSSEELADLGPAYQDIFLGLFNGIARFAVDVSNVPSLIEKTDELGYCFQDCRKVASLLPHEQTGILAQARSQLEWHKRNKYCGNCGNKTLNARGGHMRRCPQCEQTSFPRTDPVVIMLVTRDDHCLLGKPAGRIANTNLYTALAGFIDQGESIEEAVRREVMEEAGISVGNVKYHSSQPWPFPYSLMIGCNAHATSTEIKIDNNELADAAWFSRKQIFRALQDNNSILEIPRPIAIAHHLIKDWAFGKISTNND
tara:strand:+ start:1981 stop:2910 length:930 start_codon:yes stop_codon:yes gene_type:complete